MHKYWGLLRYYSYTYIIPQQEVFSADEVADRIFVGDLYSAFNRKGLKSRSITHIICMLPGIPNIYPEIAYLQLPSLDDVSFDISMYFTRAIVFLEQAMKSGGSALIHCSCGVSRSSTIAALYEMHRTGDSADEVIERFRASREIICPNAGFVLHLRNWHLSRMLTAAMET